MPIYTDKILPHFVDFVLGHKQFQLLRKKALIEARGVVLELGFGSGLNLPHYGSGVSKVIALDPSMEGRKIAHKRIGQSNIPVEFQNPHHPDLSLPEKSVDCIVSTFTLCTIPEVLPVLINLRKYLKRPGKLIFLEHGLADDPALIRWQKRLNPLNKRLGGGCCLDRKIDDIIGQAGFSITNLQTFQVSGPPTHTFLYQGIAEH